MKWSASLPLDLMRQFYLSFSRIIASLIDVPLWDQPSQYLLVWGEWDCLCFSPASTYNFSLNFIPILKLLVLLLHEILKIFTDHLIDPLVLFGDGLGDMVLVVVVLTELMIEKACLMGAILSFDELGAVSGGTVVNLDGMVVVMWKIPQGGYCPCRVQFAAVCYKRLHVLVFDWKGVVLWGNDDFVDGSVATEVAIAAQDLRKWGLTSRLFNSFMSPLASTRSYSTILS